MTLLDRDLALVGEDLAFPGGTVLLFEGEQLVLDDAEHALLAGVLASVACGTVGSFVVVRRITAIAGAIAHCVLGGLGLARWLQVVHGWTWLDPMTGAVIAAVAAALILGVVSLRAREREDTLIAALWAVGMAIGVIFSDRRIRGSCGGLSNLKGKKLACDDCPSGGKYCSGGEHHSDQALPL